MHGIKMETVNEKEREGKRRKEERREGEGGWDGGDGQRRKVHCKEGRSGGGIHVEGSKPGGRGHKRG